MKIRFGYIVGVVSLLVAGTGVAAERLSSNPRELGPVVLKELAVREGKVILRVASNGCTDQAAIRANVRKEEGMTARIPHYVVTFERVRVDDCKALLSEGVVLEYDFARDLKLPATATLTVTNWIHAQSRETSEDKLKTGQR